MTARLAGWAWWSKQPGSGNDYGVVDSDLDRRQWDTISARIKGWSPSNPPRTARPDTLPWLAFVSSTEPAPQIEVCCWDWTSGQDHGGRPILGLLYLNLAVDGPIGFQKLADYARTASRRYRDDRDDTPGPLPELGAPDPAELLRRGEDADWAAAVAALTLCSPVRIDAAGVPAGSDPTRLLDEVVALLPAPVRATLALCTGTTDSGSGVHNISVGRRTANAVQVGVLPDLHGEPAAHAYESTLRQLMRSHRITDIAAHLAALTRMPRELGAGAAYAASEHLAGLDRLVAVGDDLLRGRPVEIGEVHALAAANDLADRLVRDAHEAYLAELLTNGGPDSLPVVARNWLAGAESTFVEAFLRRPEPVDAEWIAEATDLLGVAGPDELLIPLLRRDAARPGVADLLTAAVVARLPAYGTRDWLLAHPDATRALLRGAGDAVVLWLGAGPHPPAWTALLITAVTGNRYAADAVTDPHWLVAATELAARRHHPQVYLPLLLDELLTEPGGGRGDPLGRLLHTLSLPEPADRATGDFILLATRDVLPPGLRTDSAAAGTESYADQLAKLAVLQPRSADAVRGRLPRVLADRAATADALVLLDRLHTAGWGTEDDLLRDVETVTEDRPELLEAENAPFRKTAEPADDLDRPARDDADAAKLARLIADGCRAGGKPHEFTRALTTWPGHSSPARLYELARRLGEDLTPGEADWQQLSTGYVTLAQILPATDRMPLTGYLEKVLEDNAEQLVTEYAEIDALQKLTRDFAAADRAGRPLPLPPREDDGTWLVRLLSAVRRRLAPQALEDHQ